MSSIIDGISSWSSLRRPGPITTSLSEKTPDLPGPKSSTGILGPGLRRDDHLTSFK
jgi:hypothetical protein